MKELLTFGFAASLLSIEAAVLKFSGGLNRVHYLIDGMIGSGSFYVHVHNDNAGSMVVDRLGP